MLLRTIEIAVNQIYDPIILKISTTQIYAKVVEKKLGEDMQLLRQKLTVHRNNDQEIKSGNQ